MTPLIVPSPPPTMMKGCSSLPQIRFARSEASPGPDMVWTVSGGLVAFVALVGGDRLVVRLGQKLLIFVAALLIIVAHAFVVIVELRLAFVEHGLHLPGFPRAVKQLAQVHRADFAGLRRAGFGFCRRGNAQASQQRNGQNGCA